MTDASAEGDSLLAVFLYSTSPVAPFIIMTIQVQEKN